MVTREQLEAIETTLTRIGQRMDREWAIGGTIALCIHDPSDVRIPLAHGFAGDLIAMSRSDLHGALNADPGTQVLPESGLMVDDPMRTAFLIGDTGAFGIAYSVNPDRETHREMERSPVALLDTGTSAVRALLLNGALRHAVTLDGLSGTRTVALTPGGVAVSALASAIVPDAMQRARATELFGPAAMAAEGAPREVAETLAEVLAPLATQLRRGIQRPHVALAGAITALMEYGQADPMFRDTAIDALSHGTSEFMEAYAREQELGW